MEVLRPGSEEEPRVALVSVPYAVKAGDAQTLGGLPASAFMRASNGSEAATSMPATTVPLTSVPVPTSAPASDPTGPSSQAIGANRSTSDPASTSSPL